MCAKNHFNTLDILLIRKGEIAKNKLKRGERSNLLDSCLQIVPEHRKFRGQIENWSFQTTLWLSLAVEVD